MREWLTFYWGRLRYEFSGHVTAKELLMLTWLLALSLAVLGLVLDHKLSTP